MVYPKTQNSVKYCNLSVEAGVQERDFQSGLLRWNLLNLLNGTTHATKSGTPAQKAEGPGLKGSRWQQSRLRNQSVDSKIR